MSLELGAFSVSLAVKDLVASRTFYKALGFTVTGGSLEQRYLIMKNESAIIGLFQGMFDNNNLTFNPGLSQQAEHTHNFLDVRDIQRHLKEQGIELTAEADENISGPAHVTLEDPDGNPILIDQFF